MVVTQLWPYFEVLNWTMAMLTPLNKKLGDFHLLNQYEKQNTFCMWQAEQGAVTLTSLENIHYIYFCSFRNCNFLVSLVINERNWTCVFFSFFFNCSFMRALHEPANMFMIKCWSNKIKTAAKYWIISLVWGLHISHYMQNL